VLISKQADRDRATFSTSHLTVKLFLTNLAKLGGNPILSPFYLPSICLTAFS
jgi:hypothetical protein